MSKSKSERVADGCVEWLVVNFLLAVSLLLVAWVVMVLEGAVADDFGWHTYSYLTWYFALLLLEEVSSVFFGPVVLMLAKIRQSVEA